MKNLKFTLLILALLSAVTIVLAAYFTIVQSNLSSLFYTIALGIYGAIALTAIFDFKSQKSLGKRKMAG